MSLSPGARLGAYEVLGLIGTGGMGEVYRAHDTRLNRDVALKILPDLFANDPDRLARFKREAQVLASLNHPNIAIIHGLEEANGIRALVLELVEGPTLADLIADPQAHGLGLKALGPKPLMGLPLEEALSIARQIAEALEVAHEHGIVHRDLKPANVKVKEDGTVKVLDFGPAKALDPLTGPSASLSLAGGEGWGEGAALSQSPTMSAAATRAGVLLGTAAYMSPEQARGKPVDRRTDIWAFGCVLYEMLTGRRLFQGEDITETIAAVVKEQPDFAQVPATVRRLLKSCLEKDPKKRLQAIGDMRLLLEDAAAPPIAASSRPWLGKGAWAVASAAVLGATLLAFIHFRETPAETPVIRSTILPPENTTLDFTQGAGLPALSPDGQRIVFGARTADGKTPLWVRALDGLTAQALAGTEGRRFLSGRRTAGSSRFSRTASSRRSMPRAARC